MLGKLDAFIYFDTILDLEKSCSNDSFSIQLFQIVTSYTAW